jgi:copper chaperone
LVLTIETSVNQILLQAPEIHCDHCKTTIEDAVGTLPGVQAVSVAISDATVDVTYDGSMLEIEAIKRAIEEQGYAVFG